MEPIIGIPENILAQFMASHSKLSMAEYHRNPAVNDTHFACKAEEDLCLELLGSIGQNHFVKLLTRVGKLGDAITTKTKA